MASSAPDRTPSFQRNIDPGEVEGKELLLGVRSGLGKQRQPGKQQRKKATNHQHRRGLKDPGRNEKGPRVLDGIRVGHEQHDISADTEDRPAQDEEASVLDLVGEVRCGNDHEESSHVRGNSE